MTQQRVKAYRFEIIQDGGVVAAVTSHDIDRGRREIMHYAIQYLQDGPLLIKGPDGISAMSVIPEADEQIVQPETEERK